MIENDNLYLKFDIGESEDLLNPESQFLLSIEEQAGNILPVLEGRIGLPGDFLQTVSNEGVNITLLYGKTRDSSVESVWRFTSYTLAGSLLIFRARPNVSFGRTRSIQVINKTSPQVMEEIASEHFTVQNSATGFEDRMKWLNPNMTHEEFTNQLWKHSFKENALLIPAITSAGVYIIKDVLDVSESFTVGSYGDEDFVTVSPSEIKGLSGQYNRLVGTPDLRTVSIDDGSYDTSQTNFEPMFGATLNRSVRNNPWGVTQFASENIHDNYFKAEKLNLSRLAALSNFITLIEILDFAGLNLLDHVSVNQTFPGSENSQDIASGTQFIKTKVTSINNASATLTIGLSKDAMTIPGLEGEFV